MSDWHHVVGTGLQVYIDGVQVGTTTAEHTLTSGTFTSTATTSWGTGIAGEWWIDIDPDMTDWPTDDIIDHFAHKLAKKRPA